MASFVVYKKRSMDADISGGSPRYVKPPSMTFEVEAEIDNKGYELVRKDDVLLGMMNKAAGEVYKDTCDTIERKIVVFDKLISDAIDKNAGRADIDKQLDGLNKAIAKDRDVGEEAAKQAVEKVWKDYARRKKEYDAYRIKIVVSIVGALASLGTSIGLMATTPFTAGVGTAASIVGTVRSAVTIAKEISSAWQEVETSLKLLGVQADMVDKIAKDTLSRKTNEYSQAVSQQFFGIAGPSIKGCKTHLETVQNKLKGVEIRTHDASIKLNEILDDQEKLVGEFMKEAQSRLAKHPSPKAKDQAKEIERELDKAIGKSRSDFVKQKDVVGDLHARYTKVKEEVDKREKQIDEMAKLRQIDERLLRVILTAVDLPLAIWESVSSQSANLAGEMASNLAPWVADLAYEKLSDKVLDRTFLAK